MAVKISLADPIAEKLCSVLGVDPMRVHRLILDLAAGQPATAYVEMYGDDSILSIDWSDFRPEIVVMDKVD